MKQLIITSILALSIFQNSYSQESTETPHNGFQFALYSGGAFGDIKGKTTDGLNPVFRGSGMIISMDFGYAKDNWSAGLFFSSNSVLIKSIEVNDTAYHIQPGYSMDNSVTGVFLCRYFMPINAYVNIKGGFGKFTLVDEDYNEFVSTDRGFGWSITAGKDFLFGKKKRWGAGGFVCLLGLKCKDLPPWQNDSYSYFAPGLGFKIAFH